MSWQRQFDGAAERLAARHADKINQAMVDGIDLPALVKEWIASQPSTNTTRQQAAVWVHHHVIPNTKPLEQALKDIYVDGYKLGRDFAATAYARARLSIKKAAPSGDELRAAYETDWSEWRVGSAAQAAYTEAPGELQRRFDEAAISEKTRIWQSSMDRLGIVMADTARAGLGVGTTTQAILEAEIGWGFSDVLTDPYKAMRIARTEINRAQSLATVATYKEYGLEKVEWLASDGECDICSDNMDVGPVEMGYEWDSIDGGITEPPAHPNCLCTIMPALDDALLDEQPQEEEGDEESAPSEVEAADLSPVEVDVPEAEQANTEGFVVDHEPAEPATNIDDFKPSSYKELSNILPDHLEHNGYLQDAIYEYTGTGYSDMNAYLREGANVSDEVMEHIETLQDALQSQSILSDLEFQRGQFEFDGYRVKTNEQGLTELIKQESVYTPTSGFETIENKLDLNSIVGQTWQSDGFLSTSTITDWQGKPVTTDWQSFGFQIKVLAPAGTNGMVINSAEAEFLMPHGSTFQIIKAEIINKQVHLTMKVISQ